MKRPRPLSAIVPAITQPFLGKKGLVLGKLLEHWASIAGAETARKTIPEKVKFSKDKKGNSSATLYLNASSADAALLEYEKGLLLEKIRLVTGETRIRDIRFVHNDHPPINRRTGQTTATRPLSVEEKQQLTAMTQGIKDEALQSVLLRFGESLYKNSDKA